MAKRNVCRLPNLVEHFSSDSSPECITNLDRFPLPPLPSSLISRWNSSSSASTSSWCQLWWWFKPEFAVRFAILYLFSSSSSKDFYSFEGVKSSSSARNWDFSREWWNNNQSRIEFAKHESRTMRRGRHGVTNAQIPRGCFSLKALKSQESKVLIFSFLIFFSFNIFIFIQHKFPSFPMKFPSQVQVSWCWLW